MKRRFENLTKKAARVIQHWWLLLIAGLLCIIAGVAVFVFPLESYVMISILVGVVMLVVGTAKLIAATASGNYLMMRGYVIVGGVIDLLLGLFLLYFCLFPPSLPCVNWASQEDCLLHLRFSLKSSDLPLFFFHGLFCRLCANLPLLTGSILPCASSAYP